MAGNWSYFVKRFLLNGQQKHLKILTYYKASKGARFYSQSQLSVSLEDVEKFHRYGVVCLRRVFKPEWIETVRKGIEKNIKNPSKFSEFLQSESKSSKGYYFNDYCNWRKIDEFEDYVLNSPAAEIACKLMKSKVAVFYHEHVFRKEAGIFREIPWHQDQSYYPIDGDQVKYVCVCNSPGFG